MFALLVALTTPSVRGATNAAALSKELTPMGAERAGNQKGTIPPWEGGLTSVPRSYVRGGHYVDPFSDDSVLFTITDQNADQYKDKLSPGQWALLKKEKRFKMRIYPTRRSASLPPDVYTAIRENASRATLVDNGNGVANMIRAIPFPIPSNGLEVIWNHLLHYRGDSCRRIINEAPVSNSGKYTLVKIQDEWDFPYARTHDRNTATLITRLRQTLYSPPQLAGLVLLVLEPLDQTNETRSAWVYNPGERRVRRGPNIAHDGIAYTTYGLRTFDQYDMFNGSTERFNWTLVGKQELYVPYNSYKLQSPDVSPSDILKPGCVNSALTRYELHRVWKVEATLKPGMKHLYSRRTFYIDEDSWQALIIDHYDQAGSVWRVSEGHPINYYDVPCVWTALETHYDLKSGNYDALGLNNQEPSYQFDYKPIDANFTPDSLRRIGVR